MHKQMLKSEVTILLTLKAIIQEDNLNMSSVNNDTKQMTDSHFLRKHSCFQNLAQMKEYQLTVEKPVRTKKKQTTLDRNQMKQQKRQIYFICLKNGFEIVIEDQEIFKPDQLGRKNIQKFKEVNIIFEITNSAYVSHNRFEIYDRLEATNIDLQKNNINNNIHPKQTKKWKT